MEMLLRASLVARLAVVLVAAFAVPAAQPFTDYRDVSAINALYAALGSPPLPGWVASGGDPCGDNWQGVSCVISNITDITINAANLGGELGNSLGNFTSIIRINLSNNNISGSIPEELPITMQQFFLSANQLSGSIPDSFSTLTQLTDVSLNNNHLVGQLPDAFSSLTRLINLDVSLNNLSGQLPPSLSSLTALTTLHIQDNQFTGTLNVLEDLPLQDLNVENNLFSGPVPVKLLNMPNFKKDGNPFNTSIAPSAVSPISSSQSSSPASGAPLSQAPANSPSGANSENPPSTKHGGSMTKIIVYVLGIALFIVAVLSVLFCLSKYRERSSEEPEHAKNQVGRYQHELEKPRIKEPLAKPKTETRKDFKNDSDEKHGQELDFDIPAATNKARGYKRDHLIDMPNNDSLAMPLPPPPPAAPLSVEKVVINPIVRPEKTVSHPQGRGYSSSSAKPFSVAFLQQYTDSFKEECQIRESRFGKVYLAELPDAKFLEVMKIDNESKIRLEDFLELVANISELRHSNIIELVGYCAEHEQRLLVYEHFSKRTLQDILHYEDDLDKSFSWTSRLQVALGAAKALEYLHECCQPPIVHQNFGSANILIDNIMAVQVSECGLASLLCADSTSQLSGRLRALYNYEAPEVQGTAEFTKQCDIYSFGVVMLELLTGREPYDSSRPRAERHLARWASSQLHDINALSRMVDPSIKGQFTEKALSRFADIISRCIQQEPEFRPPISQVVQDLTSMFSDTKVSLR